MTKKLFLLFFVIPYYSWGSCDFDAVAFTNYEDLIRECCDQKKVGFGNLWSRQGDQCNCQNFKEKLDNMGGTPEDVARQESHMQESHIVEVFNKCLSQAREDLTDKCLQSCRKYISKTTGEHCHNIINMDYCENICSEKAVRGTYVPPRGHLPPPGFLRRRIEAIENSAAIGNKRTECFNHSRERFIEKYTEMCLRKIAQIERQKGGENEKLLCQEGVTRSQPGCEEYCREQGKNVHDKPLTAEEVIDEQFMRGYALDGLQGTDNIHKHEALLNIDNAVTMALNPDVSNRGLVEDISRDGTISLQGKARTLAGNKYKLSWWKCKKGASMPCESDLEVALHEAVQSCAELQSAAQECCHNPESCVGGGLATAMDGLGKMNVALSAFRGPQAQCDAVQQTHGLYSGMQGAMAAQCTNKSQECVRGCQEKVDKVSEAFKAACDEYPTSGVSHDTGRHTCDADFFNHYKKAYTSSENEKQVSISSVPDKCKTTGKEANRRINDMTTNAGTSLLASMKECGWDGENWKSSAFSGGPTGMNVLPSEDDNTTTGSSSTGGGIQIPDLPDPTTTVGGGGNEEEERRGLLPDGLTAQQAVSPFDMEPGLGGEPEEGPPAPAGKMGGLLGGSGSGGSGLGGLGGGGSSGGRGRSGSGAGAKKGKKVLLGYRGGKFKGYGGGAGGSASGGSRASSRRSASKKGRGMASLDLKKLLPKGKQLNNKIGKYGSPHDDIFKRLSDRIQWMCRTRRINCK